MNQGRAKWRGSLFPGEKLAGESVQKHVER